MSMYVDLSGELYILLLTDFQIVFQHELSITKVYIFFFTLTLSLILQMLTSVKRIQDGLERGGLDL